MKRKINLLALVALLITSAAGYAQTNAPAADPPAKADGVTSPATSPQSDSATKDSAPADSSAAPAANPATDAAKQSSDTARPSGDAASQAADAAKASPTNGTPATTSTAAPADPAAATAAATNAPANTTAAVQPESPAPAAGSATNTPSGDPTLVAANTPGQAKPEQAAPVASAPQSNSVIPLIVMDDVPLSDAIKNLARQAGLNYMLDPKIAFGQIGPDGKPIPQPSVSIRWENITAEQALNALLNNNNLQLVEDPKTHIARVTVKDPAAPDPLVTKVIQLKYANPSNILASVQTTLTDRRSKVMADVRTSQLVVLATEKELIGVDELVERLDTQTKQVLIEARLVETSLNPTTTKGIDWTGTLQAQHLAFGNNLQQNNPQQSVNNTLANTFPKMLFDTAKGFNPATAFLDADGVNAVFSFLNTDSEAKVLSAPRTVTLDNEMASIAVTRASPIFKNTAGTQGSPGGSEVTYTNLGVILNVTPRISANNFVNLRVVPEVSRVFDTVRKTVASTVNEADEYDIRKIDTHVMIPSGNTLVLGGMVQDDVRKSNTKVPFMGDLPLVGAAFRSGTKSRQKSNLLIFITPTIVTDDDYQPTKSDFLKTPVPTTDSMSEDWSAWDSGKPMDWSKPAYDESQFQGHRDPTK
jgi:type II secretory pathway component GspD/PulD (secretin)